MKQSSFQDIILTLQNFWAARGCLIAQPYYTQVGAGTMNPATFLRVLGPEPWNVAYVEPSVRPDDGRYGENPNRFQLHYQYQVILKPDPGNPQELYLESLKALGIDPREHDIRFVEDNWEQPAISAWGLGWEVWLDGQEITQFTYFQQVGGVALDPVAVELTYGLERILIALNNAKAIWDEPWGANVKYGEIRKKEEFEHSQYYFEVADVERVRKMYDLYRAEAEACLAKRLVLPAHDYVLKCSHVFNTLDTRGAIGVTERQAFFGQMRDLARRVAEAYLEQRKELGYPLLRKEAKDKLGIREEGVGKLGIGEPNKVPLPFVLEIGTEELPAGDVDAAQAQLQERIPSLLDDLHLKHGQVHIFATPRRLAVLVEAVAPRQPDREDLVKGPPADKAFDKDGKPTAAALGFARKNGIEASALEVREMDGGKYAAAIVKQTGKPAAEVFAQALPGLINAINFDKSMKWNDSGISFSRPIRWLAALLGDSFIPFEYAGVVSGCMTRGLRPYGSPDIKIADADKYLNAMSEAGIVLDGEERKKSIVDQVTKAAASKKGEAIIEDDLLREVMNLVEKPTAVLGSFDKEFLSLPREVLISTMKKHQRYFPISDPKSSQLLPYFIAIRNGDAEHLDIVRQGNEHVLAARFADADFFVREDLKHKLEDYRPKLAKLIFQKQLGSMLDKSERMLKLSAVIAAMLQLDETQRALVQRAAFLAKADLTTQMVTEMTSLQGVIGREYALRSGENQAAAEAIGEQYQPVPKTIIGLTVALADRLDSLAGLFAAGLAPTGTKDPFGLRRAAIGVVQPLIEHKLKFDLTEAIKKAAQYQPITASAEIQEKILDFITGRLSVLLKESGIQYDVVDAILAAQSKNPAGCVGAAEQLTKWTQRGDWHDILPAFARCVRITRDQKTTFRLNEKSFIEKEEKDLYATLLKAEASTAKAEQSVDTFLNAFLPMIPAINAFFEKILVMAEDKTVRENRLALLQRIAALPEGLADLSKLEGF